MSVDFVDSITGRKGSSGSMRAESSDKYPIESSTTSPFFPAVCLRSHWDPTARLRRIVPQDPAQPLPTDFRPWVKVCMNYTTSGPEEAAPLPPPGMVFGPGGSFYPPGRYAAAIGDESLLRRLDRPLGTCEDEQFRANEQGDMYVPGINVPKYGAPTSKMVSELAMPRVLVGNSGAYSCRQEADTKNTQRSQLMFNNATKQQRYKDSQLR